MATEVEEVKEQGQKSDDYAIKKAVNKLIVVSTQWERGGKNE